MMPVSLLTSCRKVLVTGASRFLALMGTPGVCVPVPGSQWRAEGAGVNGGLAVGRSCVHGGSQVFVLHTPARALPWNVPDH